MTGLPQPADEENYATTTGRLVIGHTDAIQWQSMVQYRQFFSTYINNYDCFSLVKHSAEY